MQVAYSKDALKQIKKLPKTEVIKVFKKIEIIKQDPFYGKKLEGEFSEIRSVRAWPYRIIYSFSAAEGLIIRAIKHRQGAYKYGH